MSQDISGGGVGQPITHIFPIIPSDTVDLVYLPRGIYVGTAGNIAVLTLGGSIAIFVGALAGSILPVRAVRVYATGTTASNLLSLV